MQFLVKGTFFRLLYMAFSFFTGMLISGWAGTATFGVISVFVVNAALLVLISGMGHDASLYWHRSSGKIDHAEALGYGWLVIVQQLAVYWLLTLGALYFSGRLLLSRMGVEFLPAEAAYFTGIILTERYITFFYSSGRAVSCNRLLSVISLITLAIAASGYFQILPKLTNPFSLFCFIPFFHALILVLFFHWRKSARKFSIPDRRGASSIFRFSFIVLITNLIQFLAYRTDYWMISYFTGDEGQVGLYAQASRFSQLFWVIPNIMAAIIYHDLSAETKTFGTEKLTGLVRGVNIINLLMIPLLIIFTWLSVSFFLQDYLESYRVFLWLLPGMFFFCNSILLASYFSARRQLWMNFWISLICFSTIFILDLWLIPLYGITGAAWANTIAYAAAGLTSLFLFIRQEGLGFIGFFMPRRTDFKLFSGILSKDD